jgi:hypothetical protein
MMERTLIGPRRRSGNWEYTAALVIAPIAALFAYRSWLLHLTDVTGSLLKIMENLRANLGGDRLLGTESPQTALGLAVLMSLATTLISLLALQFADSDGRPVLMLRRWIRLDNPDQSLRHEYVNQVKLKLGPSRRWVTLAKYTVATAVISFTMYEILQWSALALAVFFLLGATFVRRQTHNKLKREFHPIVRTIPMLGIGLSIAAVSVSVGNALWSFAAIAVLGIVALFIRTRTLWD